MREILFKARTTKKHNRKHDFNDVWVEGDLVRSAEKYYIHPIANKVKIDGELGKIIVVHEVEPDTLCQYTGLTDKNGNKIWENDILKCKKYIGGNFVDYCIEVGYVEMKHGAFGLHRIKNDAYYRPFKDWLEDYEYEVVGNIFDNPELLEAE